MTVICWFRRVLRLDDHPALVAAAAAGAVIPLPILRSARSSGASAIAWRCALAGRSLASRGSGSTSGLAAPAAAAATRAGRATSRRS
ncbi:MAG: deoxyribodipyrimidine photo-lyase, partial [Paracoccus marcusii]